MPDRSETIALALLAILEKRAKKKGKRSYVKGVIKALRDGGADSKAILAVEALSGGKSAKLAAAKIVRSNRAPKAKAAAVSVTS